jgi:Fe-S-cluster-containing hydrogenase component 2
MVKRMDERFVTRRDFMRMLAGLGITVSAAAALSNIKPLRDLLAGELALETLAPSSGTEAGSTRGAGDRRFRWGMVIDLRKCIGCRYCVYACQAVNDVPDDMRWNVYLLDRTPTGEVFHMTRPCLHCQDAPCVSVCPVGATFVRDDGLVMMDYNKCIGCRYCQVACPYGARSFNWRERMAASGYQPNVGQCRSSHAATRRRRKVHLLRAPD